MERKRNRKAHALVKNDDEDAIKEAGMDEFKASFAKAEQDKKDKEKEIEKEKERLSKQNIFDGTIHIGNGDREFFDGGAIGGVNNYHQTKASMKQRL